MPVVCDSTISVCVMLAEMAQSHYDLVQGSFVILVKFRKQDLVLVKESGAEARVRLQHNLNMCKNRIDVPRCVILASMRRNFTWFEIIARTCVRCDTTSVTLAWKSRKTQGIAKSLDVMIIPANCALSWARLA